ncbi:MAG: cyclic nucleotide-binding domain-containing protein, partial [Methylococcales bacterium]
DSHAAKFALAHQVPRKIDAVAKGRVRFLRVNANLVNNLLTPQSQESRNAMDIEDNLDDTEDWMTALLRLPIFQRLPPANLQKILISLESVRYRKGDVIVEQGGRGDYYYLIKEGQCILTRKPSPNAKEIKLAQLTNGDTFGEDALLSDAPRNVTITAMTDMTLLRLEKKQFISLIKEPSLKFLNYAEVCEALKSGATLLDVRYQDEYENRHLAGSINVPFFTLRMQLKNLNRDKPIIVVCSNGRASEAAAFFLLKNRFDAMILKDGMEGVMPHAKDLEENAVAQFEIDDGVEIPIESTEPLLPVNTENKPNIAEKEVPDISEDDLRDQIKFLKSENETLRKTLTQLNEKRLKLEQDKEHSDKQYRILYKQMEKLTHVLDKLKNS